MSTYGKKALVYWNYLDKHTQEELFRFNNSTHNIQEEIVKKWYPIGFTCKKISKSSLLFGIGSYKVIRHVKVAYGWRVEVIDEKGYISTIHPGTLKPDKEWDREEKLKKLGI